ncbi:hypothetical protein MKW94_014531 [Papaver nudicaule]|uniref:Pectinesterase inhibitor domain-containing protein n=1 Tax=Papaver nudicaule TaxID=74823 RepID=A0AA41UX93_PAPNU|nr:hypothetical protein [Papaver nudicaule]
MSPLFSLLWLSLSSIIFALLVPNFHGVNGDLINDVCLNASTPVTDPQLTYDFCVASLSANPASKHADLLGLGVISMQTCLQNATSIHSFIDQILKDGKEAPEAKPLIMSCLGLYSDAIRSVKKAIKNFKIKDYNSANIEMSAAMDASTGCEDGFKEVLNQALTPLTKQDDEFFQLTGISLVITKMV